ncbi:MAG TPA: transglycosylase domain-containing protein [Candidatus Dormibacteraeota bacterium]|nr:transglycosylase domain-containing protein [Candidatus Dormibacteraeota bacterium]
MLLGVIGIGAVLAYTMSTLKDLPNPAQAPSFANSVTIYASGGQVLQYSNSSSANYEQLNLSQMGKWAPLALMGAEDRNFYEEGAFDPLAIARSAYHDVRYPDGGLEGGSTITQELVKMNENWTYRRTPLRKLQELILAIGLQRHYSKDQILLMYLNRAPFGHNAYGFGAASTVYFGKPADQLDVAQAAFLAGLVRGPSYYDPQFYYPRAKARQVYVLQGMQAKGWITPAQEKQAVAENIQAELTYTPLFTQSISPHFNEYVMSQVDKRIGANALAHGNYKVYTTLDYNLQLAANKAVTQGVASLGPMGVNNGALLAAQPSTGAILAYVGSANFNDAKIQGQFDVVSQGSRQPGSSFKPYVYAAALRDHKITLDSVVPDTRYDYPGTSTPVLDWDDSYEGQIPAWEALLHSRNVPAVKIGQMEGMANANTLAEQMMNIYGKQQLENYPAAAIGGASGISIMDNVQGYSTFANMGKMVPLVSITKIEDNGTAIYNQTPGTQAGQTQVLSPAVSYLIMHTLKNYQNYWDLNFPMQMASKSGTTGGKALDVNTDGWLMTYNPSIVVGAWGANTAVPDGTISAYGTDVGSQISRRFLDALPASYRNWYSQVPSGIVQGAGCQGQASSQPLLTGTQASCPSPTPTPSPTPSPVGPVQPTPVEPTPEPTPPSFFPTPTPSTGQPTPPPFF